MTLNREIVERELEASKRALSAHEEGILIHKVVIAAFQSELDKLPKEKENK